MYASIEAINHDRNFLMARIHDNEYCVIKLIGHYAPQIGDVLFGEFQIKGRKSIENVTQKKLWYVCIHHIRASIIEARECPEMQ